MINEAQNIINQSEGLEFENEEDKSVITDLNLKRICHHLKCGRADLCPKCRKGIK